MSRRAALKGLAFDISDLQAIRSWAEHHALRAQVRLDHGVGEEEYEEVIAFHLGVEACQLLLWRDENAVFAQPLLGRRLRFASVAEALSRLDVKHTVPVGQ